MKVNCAAPCKGAPRWGTEIAACTAATNRSPLRGAKMALLTGTTNRTLPGRKKTNTEKLPDDYGYLINILLLIWD
ncbi:MAG: hypothetical protein HY965_07835 [Ignavibacteriales bacterium]|nr:hypothetical protein [Ignavibacteriales bacterium]